MTIKAQYIKNFTFGLKDFNSTKSKYENYKPRGGVYESLNDLDVYNILDIDTWYLLSSRSYLVSHMMEMKKEEMKPKTFANRVRTYINSLSFQYNIKAYKELWYTDSQSSSLATRFYIENYEAINNKMQEFMIDFMQSTCYHDEYFID